MAHSSRLLFITLKKLSWGLEASHSFSSSERINVRILSTNFLVLSQLSPRLHSSGPHPSKYAEYDSLVLQPATSNHDHSSPNLLTGQANLGNSSVRLSFQVMSGCSELSFTRNHHSNHCVPQKMSRTVPLPPQSHFHSLLCFSLCHALPFSLTFLCFLAKALEAERSLKRKIYQPL